MATVGKAVPGVCDHVDHVDGTATAGVYTMATIDSDGVNDSAHDIYNTDAMTASTPESDVVYVVALSPLFITMSQSVESLALSPFV